MPISKDKEVISAAIPKDLKAELAEIARQKDRSLSYLLIIALKDYINNQKAQNALSNEKNTHNE